MEIYNKQPLSIISDIPVFTNTDTKYIRNYDAIANDHLRALERTGENPYGNKKYTEFANKEYLTYINKYTKNNDIVLDAGVGIGDILCNFNTPNKYGVDISIEYLKMAKANGVNVCLAMIEDLPYKDELFDVVLCKDVFEHVFNLYGCVKNVLRVLKKGGYLIFQVPYRQQLEIYLNYTKFDYVHLRNFDEYSIILMFQKIFDCKCLEYKASICSWEDNCNIIDVVIQK
jgi:2-polyprenyl-3-methyl-5-hydroxy-6-metoxy-1,4-benzoquinol methylase